VAEESPSHNVILWAVQLEQERLARLEHTKLPPPARLLEIHFVRSSNPREVGEPIVVRDSYVKSRVSQPARILPQKLSVGRLESSRLLSSAAV
jgi:hypothetical protein